MKSTKPALTSFASRVSAVPRATPPRNSCTVSFKPTTDGRLTRMTRAPSDVSRTLSLRSEPTTERVGTSETALTAVEIAAVTVVAIPVSWPSIVVISPRRATRSSPTVSSAPSAVIDPTSVVRDVSDVPSVSIASLALARSA